MQSKSNSQTKTKPLLKQTEAYGRLKENVCAIYPDRQAKRLLDKLSRRLTVVESTDQDSLSERDTVLIAYGDHLRHRSLKPLAALYKFSATHLSQSFSTLHILPFYPYTSDDGYSVSDFKRVNPKLGDWSDIARLGRTFKLMFDLPLNHVSAAHAWFQKFLRNETKYRDYFISLPPDTDVSQVVRPRSHPLLSKFETSDGPKYVWTTFSLDQIDLNYDNPDVLLEIIDTLLLYVQRGANAIRLDAVGFLWKRPYAASIHLPETHKLIEIFRSVLDITAPDVLLVTETNVPHTENISYFGDGEHEANLVYNFALPPLLLQAMQTGDTRILSDWAGSLKTPSRQTAFFNFTASHDGIGLRPIESILSRHQLNQMIAKVQQHGGLVSYRTDPDGALGPYELNISYFDAVAAPDDDTDTAIAKFMVTQAAALALSGVPGVYLSSLFGAGSWRNGVRQLGQNRAINRQKFELTDKQGVLTTPELEVPSSRTAQVFDRYQRLLHLRRQEPAFHPHATQEVLSLDSSVFALKRTSLSGRSTVLALHNFSGATKRCQLPPGAWRDLVGANKHQAETVELDPYQICWLKSS